MRHKKTAPIQGVTLVELVIGIVIIAIAFVSVINIFSFVTVKNADSQAVTIANYLCQGKMEEWMAKGYAGIGEPGVVSFCFDGAASALDYSGQFSNYYYTVQVNYASKIGETIAVSDPSLPRAPFNLKKVSVTVEKRNGQGGVVFSTTQSRIFRADYY